MLIIEAAKSEPRVPDLPSDDIADGAFRDWALEEIMLTGFNNGRNYLTTTCTLNSL